MDHQMTRRQLLRMGTMGAAVAMLAACQPKIVEVEKIVKETVVVKEASGAKTTLVFSPRTGPPAEVFKPYFEEKYPNIDLRWEVGAGDIRQRLTAHMMAGDAPDVFGTCCQDSVFFIQQGQCLSLQPFMDREDYDLGDFHQQQFKSWTLNGEIYAIPSYTGTYALYYNQDMFDEAGIDAPPANWGELSFEDYHQMLLKVAKPDADPKVFGVTGYCMAGGGSSWVTQVWLRGFGARMVNPDNWDECMLCEPEAIECLEMLQKMVHEEGTVGCGGEAQRWIGPALFAGGGAACLEMGSWGLNTVIDGAQFNWNVGGMWGGKGGPTSHVSVDCDEVWQGTPYPEEAWILINELTSREAEIMQIDEAGIQPSRLSVLDEWITRLKNTRPAFENINLKAFKDVIEQNIGDQEEFFTEDNVVKNTILAGVLDSILLLNERPAQDVCGYAELATRYNMGEVALEDVGAEMEKLD